MKLKICSLACCLMLFFSETARAASPPSASSKQVCLKSPVQRSICMVQAVLKDVESTYKAPGGGGIGHIKQRATDTYEVSFLQEEKVDSITYKFEIGKSGEVKIIEKKESVPRVGR